MAVEIRLLGTLEVITPNGGLTAADFPTRKAKQVLEVLALTAGRTVSKDALIDMLWRRKWPQNPTATVELAVSLLRTTLAKVSDERLVLTDAGGYRLDASVALVDLTTLDDLAVRADRLAGAGRLALLREAVALIRGPLLEDEVGAEWLQPYRDRYRRKAEATQLALAREALAQGDATLAHSVAERAWSSSELIVEEAYAVGVAALVQLGRRSEARALLRRVEQRLGREEGRGMAAELLGLQALLDTVTPAGRPIVLRVDPAFAGAPSPPPFLGRAESLAAIDEFAARTLSADGASGSLVVTGPAGIGRSRLLAEVVARAGESRQVHTIQCLPSDREHALLTVGRLVRSIRKTARLRDQPVVDGSVTAMFGRLALMLDDLGPAVLVVDDLHRADAESVAVLRSLAAPGGALQLCLVMSSPVALDGGADAAALELTALTEADLQPLGIGAAWRETGGHPATLAACCAAGAADAPLPDDVVAALRARVAELASPAPLVLAGASRLSEVFTGAEVAAAAGIGPAIVEAGLHAAVAGGVVRALGAGRFEFSAQLVRRLLATEAAAPFDA